MPSNSRLTRPWTKPGFLRTGLCIGVAGGLAEIGVVWLYSALTGGDAASIARGVASAVGLAGTSAATGVAIHMALAAALGVGLNAVLQIVAIRPVRAWVVFPFMLVSLEIVWEINFFLVLPTVSPGFALLLPYAMTLASKLAFGLAAGATLRALPPAVWARPAPGPRYAPFGSMRTETQPESGRP
jgi:hypothetical protein